MTATHHSDDAGERAVSNEPDDGGGGLPVDAVFDVLRSPRRRYVLYQLSERSEPMGVDALAARVAAWEDEPDGGGADGDDRRRVLASLHHTHLPKLIELGLVEYDEAERRVTMADRTAAVDPYLAFAAEYELEE